MEVIVACFDTSATLFVYYRQNRRERQSSFSERISKKEPHSEKWLTNELYECSSVVVYG